MLYLYIPKIEDLWFRKKMLSDPKTMSYNKNWEVDYEGYDKNTGCIEIKEEDYEDWLKYWTNKEPDRFYAYVCKENGEFIGEVNFHYNPEKNWHDMGVVIYSKYRGNGYGTKALKLLLKQAFEICKIERIHNDFSIERNEISAWKTHYSAGFKEYHRDEKILELMITKEGFEYGN